MTESNKEDHSMDHVVKTILAAQRWRAVMTGDLGLFRTTRRIQREMAEHDERVRRSSAESAR